MFLPIFAQGYCLYGMDFKAFGRQEAQAKVESWKSEANLWIPNVPTVLNQDVCFKRCTMDFVEI